MEKYAPDQEGDQRSHPKVDQKIQTDLGAQGDTREKTLLKAVVHQADYPKIRTMAVSSRAQPPQRKRELFLRKHDERSQLMMNQKPAALLLPHHTLLHSQTPGR